MPVSGACVSFTSFDSYWISSYGSPYLSQRVLFTLGRRAVQRLALPNPGMSKRAPFTFHNQKNSMFSLTEQRGSVVSRRPVADAAAEQLPIISSILLRTERRVHASLLCKRPCIGVFYLYARAYAYSLEVV